MIDEQLVADVKHSHERLRIMALLPERWDIKEWAELCIDLATGKTDAEDVRPFTPTEKNIVDAIDALLATSSRNRTVATYEPMPPGSMFPYLSLSPLFLVAQMLNGHEDEQRFFGQPFANESDLETYFDGTIIAPFEYCEQQKANYAWTKAETSKFIWHWRDNNPVLFFQIIGREYHLAETGQPWLLQVPSECAVKIASQIFPTAKCSSSSIMRSVGNAQRLRCIAEKLNEFSSFTVGNVKSISDSDEPEATAHNLSNSALTTYLSTIGTSALALRKRLMLDCSNSHDVEHRDLGADLDRFGITGLAEGKSFHDRLFSGVPVVKAKGMVAQVIGEAGRNYPTCRKAGNGGTGNDNAVRETGSGGPRNLPLGTYYGHTLQQLVYGCVLQTIEASNMPLRCGSAGQFAQYLVADITQTDFQMRKQNAQALMELEKDYHEQGNHDFGSPLAMASFDIAKWSDPGEQAERWALLADGENGNVETDDQAYYLVAREQMQSFWFDGLRSPLFDTSTLVWSHTSHAANSLSGDLSWQLIRNAELKSLGISNKARRAKKVASKPKGNPSRQAKPANKTKRVRDHRLKSFEDILPAKHGP
ncbi:hypothetical protein OAS19_06070 [Altererythrobacter sp.]|nr:hypothetical protein [Altererythrobacter sp.]